MKMTIFLLMIVIVCAASTCKQDPACKDDGHPGLTFVNNSDKPLHFEIYWNYPDTTFVTAPHLFKPVFPADSFTRGAARNGCWESIFANSRKEWIYIFDHDIIKDEDWETVQRTGIGLLERREIDLIYLQTHDFTVTYP